jgi:hypothetical protein
MKNKFIPSFDNFILEHHDSFTEENNIQDESTQLFENELKQIAGWLFFPYISILNAAFKYYQKKNDIKELIAKEKSAKEKTKLYKKLNKLKADEVGVMLDLKIKREKFAKKAKEAKKGFTKEEKEAWKKHKEKFEEQIEDLKFKLEKERSKSTIAKGFV